MNTPVGILGSGNLATALVPYLLAKGTPVSGIWGRNSDAARRIAAVNTVFHASEPGNLVERSRLLVLAVSDDALADLAGQLARFDLSGRVIIHASGCLGLDHLAPATRAGGIAACVHPLMTLSWNADGPNPLEGSPCGVACPDHRWKRILSAWLRKAGNPCFPLVNGARPLYHASAVLACAGLAQVFSTAALELSKGLGIAVSEARYLLAPLARRTLTMHTAAGAISGTGPWARGDRQTTALHLAALREENSKAAALYEALMNLAVDEPGNGQMTTSDERRGKHVRPS
ncbi:MAG TPA: DUF2520 domain-containing protein [Candidatus Ozemobacteraceae bacterium]|nr:DUF2520 domain-containing protein [Candidatus Ozemobacteraceae bacterium]